MKKLDKVGELVLKLNGDLQGLNKYGFRKVSTNSASGFIFVHRKKGIVVKRPCIVTRKIPQFAIPTLIIKKRHEYYRFHNVFIQPLADTSNTRLAHTRLIDLGYDKRDHKADNCGWYRRKPVLLDW